MKTSTLFLLAAVAIMMSCLAVYDLQLRAEVRKGDYAKPLYRYRNLDLTAFNRVELRASTVFNVRLEPGPFRVSMGPDMEDFLVTRVVDSTLIIEAHFPDHNRNSNNDPAIYVNCPALCSFRSDAWYTVNGGMFVDGTQNPYWRKLTTISGFEGDSLAIQEENGSDVLLEGINYKHISALLGAKKEGWNAPVLTIGDKNHFNSGDLNILGHGQLWVTGPEIRQLNYHFGDSASLTISGAAARHLKIN
jgi:hypothetical protein